MTILILESDRLLNVALSRGLEKEKHTILSCFDVDAALSCIKNQKVDFIISDLNSPLQGGLSFLVQLKKVVALKIPIIIVSASVNARKIIDDSKINCLSLHTKPIDPVIILEEVAKYVSSKT